MPLENTRHAHIESLLRDGAVTATIVKCCGWTGNRRRAEALYRNIVKYQKKGKGWARTCLGSNTDRQWDYENGFYLTSHATRLAKMLAHYELYKSIIHLPSHCRMRGV